MITYRRVRWLAWLGVGVCVVVLALGITEWLLIPPGEPPGVTESNVRRLRRGMTLEEVEAVLGVFEGSIAIPAPQGASQLTDREGLRALLNDPERRKDIVGDKTWLVRPAKGGSAAIQFGENGRLRRAEWWPGGQRQEPTSLLDRLRSWLGW